MDRVAVANVSPAVYPTEPPFDPPERYPELGPGPVDASNSVYAAVRGLLRSLGLDELNYGSTGWSPFSASVRPGMTVFIKPNLVMHRHGGSKNLFSVITHASVLRPIIDYVLIALQEAGRIIIGDSPLINGRFDKAAEASGITPLVEWYRGRSAVHFDLLDLRTRRVVRSWLYGKWHLVPVMQDPEGYAEVDLANHSMFEGVDARRLRIAVASYRDMQRSHGTGTHRYTLPKSFLSSDVVINVAKLKTHRRTGVTLCLKNFMGVPAAKGSLPHFRLGSPSDGGDQYVNPSARKRACTWLHDRVQASRFIPVKFACALVKKILWNTHWIFPFRDDVFEAMWPGNDTVWRTLLDLNRIVQYADKTGVVRTEKQRRLFCLVDGVIGGERDGPLAPDPVASGILLGGLDPVAVDCVASTLMGFDAQRIRLIQQALADSRRPLPITTATMDCIRVTEAAETCSLEQYAGRRNLRFEPHPGWKGCVERA